MRCGICGRRMESCWANNRAAYCCRHGHTSAFKAGPDRRKNLYVREDRILVHLPTLYILLAKPDPANALPSAEDVIGHLRAEEITLTYDSGILRVAAQEGVKITIDRTR
ncbi:zinc ribbon domain-containing protein [Actinoallomurus sp. NPDC052274]|uniref:zinc ribbon domain-containing protein n=1 Tax=Actinoallomurus sp. NPDC052274 TaxID=3155420 RepID=UPI00344763F7